MKKLHILLLLLLGFQPLLWSQVAINSDNVPNGNLLVRPSSYTSPDSKSGVLIPRVGSLAASAADGMIVYLNNPNPQSTGELSGFYYWDEPTQKWIPFISRYSSLLAPPSVFYASGIRFRNAPTNSISDIGTSFVKPVDQILLENLTTNNDQLCMIVPKGYIEIKKAGWYYIQISITLTKEASPPGLRDILNVQLRKTNPNTGADELVTLGSGGTIQFEGLSSFPGQVVNSAGNQVTNLSQTIVSQAPVRLESGDLLSLYSGIIYIDPRGEVSGGGSANARSKAIYTLTANTDASIAGRYMGDF